MTSSPAFLAFAAAVSWFMVFLLVHIAGLRARFENARWLSKSYAIAILGTLFTIALMMWGYHDIQVALLAVVVAVLTSACLLALYIPALYTVLTSVSVETMIFLRARHLVAETELYDRFASRSIIEQRLATMRSNGYIIADGSSFRLTGRGRIVATIFANIKDFWNLGPGG